MERFALENGHRLSNGQGLNRILNCQDNCVSNGSPARLHFPTSGRQLQPPESSSLSLKKYIKSLERKQNPGSTSTPTHCDKCFFFFLHSILPSNRPSHPPDTRASLLYSGQKRLIKILTAESKKLEVGQRALFATRGRRRFDAGIWRSAPLACIPV